ncbi:MAG: DNA replication protein, partial [Candidatus Hodarchaeota archaeon]
MAEELDLITRFEEFLKTYKTEEGDTPYNDAIARLSLEEAISVPIDFNHLVTFDPDLASATRSHPQQAIDAASAAIRRILQVVDPDYYQTIEKPHARFKEIPDRVSVRLIRAEHIGQLIMVDALVTRVSDVKPLLVEGVFQCRQCQEIIYVQQTHQFVPPPLCTNEACRSKGPFDLIPERSKFVDWQKIRLQEKPEELPPGALPRALDCILQEDLVDIARPGDPCRIVGILRSTQDTTARTRRKAPTFTSFLATNYVAVSEREADRVEITPKEEETIHDLAQDPLIHRKLVNSIAPSIYGLTDEKEAVSLLLFGGVPKTLADGVKIRGDSNILLVGDPGTAKSQLLKYVAQIAPRGLYTSGKGSTAAGLTAAVLRDPDTEGFALEAGALVLADRGTACLHPSSRVLADNKLSTIEALFSQTTPATAVSNGETVMVGRLDVKVPSLTKDLDMIECKSTYIRKKAGPSSLLKISTETGFSTIVTPDHMLLDGASLEWKKAQDFTKGESLVAPLKVPGYNDPVYIFDLIPADWIVCLNQDEKTELRTELFKHFSSLASINRFFGLRRDVLSGRSQMKVGTLHRILSHLGIFNEWRKRKLSFGRKQSGERLKVSEITPELAYFLGFVYGDGWDRINKRRSSLSVHQSWVNQEQIHRLIECYSTFSRRSLRNYPRTCESEIRGSEVLCQSTIFTANSNLLAQIYNYLLANDLSNLLQLPNDSLAAFIGGIIDSDGCISIKCDRRSDSDYYTAHIDIQCSNNWIENQSLLLSLRRFDCYGRLKPGRGVIHVQITARVDVEALLHAIKPYSVKIKLLPKSIRTISSLSDRLPSKPIAQLAEQISTINTAMLVEKGLWSTIYSYKHERYAPSRGQVKKIQTMLDDHLSPAQHELIDNLLKRDYFLDPISSIEEIPYDGPVYDLHVPQTHNFTADGLITHNCIDEFDKMRPQDRTAI